MVATVVSAPTAFEETADRSSDTSPSSRTLSLGSVDAPTQGTVTATSQPVDVPLAEGTAPADGTSQPMLRRTETDASFSAVGVSWRYDASSATSIALRTKSRAGEPWSAWHATTAEATGRTDERDGTGAIWTGPAAALDVVVTSLDGAPVRDVRVGLIDPGKRAADTTAADTPDITAKAGGVQLDIRSRSQWGADEKMMTWAPEYAPKVAATVIHHTATTTNYTAEQVPAILRSIYRYQASERGWGDIGYNIIVDAYGRAWEGRAGGVDKAVVGAHAQGFNTGTSGIALIGNYVTDAPSPAALETMSKAVAYKLGPSGIKPNATVPVAGGPGPRHATAGTFNLPAVMGHDAVGRTACPGGHLDAALPALRVRATAFAAVST